MGQTGHIGNMVVNGSGDSIGGEFRRMVINGESTIHGDIRSETCKIRGTGEVKGNLQSDKVRVMGTCEVRGNLTGEDVRVMGSCDVDGNLAVDTVRIKGSLTIHGDCEAESFVVFGGFCIDGLLNAGTVNVGLYGPSRAKEIGGGSIRVRPRFPVFQANKTLTVDLVEGDDIHLDYTFAKVVRGNRVTIGPGCDIDLVEYQSEITVAKSSTVGTLRKV